MLLLLDSLKNFEFGMCDRLFLCIVCLLFDQLFYLSQAYTISLIKMRHHGWGVGERFRREGGDMKRLFTPMFGRSQHNTVKQLSSN